MTQQDEPKNISKEQHLRMLNLCKNGRHKFRENEFGVTWCVVCGLLSTSIGFAKPLVTGDKLIIEKNYDTGT